MDDTFSDSAALLGVELRGVEVVLVEGRTEGQDIVGGGYGVLAEGYVVAVDEVNEFSSIESLEQG